LTACAGTFACGETIPLLVLLHQEARPVLLYGRNRGPWEGGGWRHHRQGQQCLGCPVWRPALQMPAGALHLGL